MDNENQKRYFIQVHCSSEEERESIKKFARSRGFKSTSEFIRYLINKEQLEERKKLSGDIDDKVSLILSKIEELEEDKRESDRIIQLQKENIKLKESLLKEKIIPQENFGAISQKVIDYLAKYQKQTRYRIEKKICKISDIMKNCNLNQDQVVYTCEELVKKGILSQKGNGYILIEYKESEE